MFTLNADIYSVNLRILSKYGKIRIRKKIIFKQFSRSRPTAVMAIVVLKIGTEFSFKEF